MENFIGYVVSGLIGVSLGLIGSGGAIITIPVLVYLFHIEPTLATAYSLFIVGTTAFVGSVRNVMNKLVDLKSAVMFSIPSALSVYYTRHYLLPLIPDVIIKTNHMVLPRSTGLMLFFAVIMIFASIRMIRSNEMKTQQSTTYSRLAIVMVQGVFIGFITGIVGSGGGFLIIPALVLFIGLPMNKAVGTSLVIIAFNSYIGFIGDFNLVHQINLKLLMWLSAVSIIGVFLGNYLSAFIQAKSLKVAFGWFAVVMALAITTKELIKL